MTPPEEPKSEQKPTAEAAREFPLLDGPSIPWTLIAPHEKQALSNHSQTLERLAERGGLSVCEAVAVLNDRPWYVLDREEATAELKRLLDADLRAALAVMNAAFERNRALLVEVCKSMKLLIDAAPHEGEGRKRALACHDARAFLSRPDMVELLREEDDSAPHTHPEGCICHCCLPGTEQTEI